MSQLPKAVLTSAQRIEALVATATAALAALKHSKLLPADLSREVTNASLSVTMISTEVRELRTVMAAARMCGQAAALMTVETLELHPANKPMPRSVAELQKSIEGDEETIISGHARAAMLESLHRAGDHSLDDERRGE